MLLLRIRFPKIENAKQIRGRMPRNPVRSGTTCQLPQSCRCRAKTFDQSATICSAKTAQAEFSEGKRYAKEYSDGQKNDDAQPTQEPAVIALTFFR